MEQSPPSTIGKKKSRARLWVVVFLIVGMLVIIGFWAVFLNGYHTGPLITPVGAFRSWTQESKSVYSVMFGVVTPDTEFNKCTIWIQPTVGDGSAQSTVFVLTNGTFAQAATPSSPGIRITDLNADNKINHGDLVTVTTRSSGYAAIDNGEWRINLIFIKSSSSIASTTFFVSGNP